jgi:hypothetical protein
VRQPAGHCTGVWAGSYYWAGQRTADASLSVISLVATPHVPAQPLWHAPLQVDTEVKQRATGAALGASGTEGQVRLHGRQPVVDESVTGSEQSHLTLTSLPLLPALARWQQRVMIHANASQESSSLPPDHPDDRIQTATKLPACLVLPASGAYQRWSSC